MKRLFRLWRADFRERRDGAQQAQLIRRAIAAKSIEQLVEPLAFLGRGCQFKFLPQCRLNGRAESRQCRGGGVAHQKAAVIQLAEPLADLRWVKLLLSRAQALGQEWRRLRLLDEAPEGAISLGRVGAGQIGPQGIKLGQRIWEVGRFICGSS